MPEGCSIKEVPIKDVDGTTIYYGTNPDGTHYFAIPKGRRAEYRDGIDDEWQREVSAEELKAFLKWWW